MLQPSRRRSFGFMQAGGRPQDDKGGNCFDRRINQGGVRSRYGLPFTLPLVSVTMKMY